MARTTSLPLLPIRGKKDFNARGLTLLFFPGRQEQFLEITDDGPFDTKMSIAPRWGILGTRF